MSSLIYLVPIALGMGLVGLRVFLWSLRSGQYGDLDGAAERILIDEDRPITPTNRDPASLQRMSSARHKQSK
ncbi:cbb3-type cytochrome oxidase assembly protein CcoS [Jiella pelagia]|uniref:Cbb3-type cytochrome oxidase assembly protein CcoS n=1 Tax=Jiella pelagia TaxID=2986949 RepID=A0ABY7BVE1_9HYPH|nr:cbb3-type cytochrome oxidase assembly protein CcoS [Jiella pelagia]WAP66709.1 cbb3-type cytochrome oxidase assembly protein CcoS [Jiella pelagia]